MPVLKSNAYVALTNYLNIYGTSKVAIFHRKYMYIIIYKTLFQVLKEDGLPTLICNKCVNLSIAAYQFKILYDNSQKFLQNYLSQINVKLVKAEVLGDIKGINAFSDTDFQDEPTCEYEEDVRPFLRSCPLEVNRDNRLSSLRKNINSRNIFRNNNLTATNLNKESNEENIIQHPCPICLNEFSALELRVHVRTHKTLRNYLSIPNSMKVKPETKFYVNASSKTEATSIFHQKEKKYKCFLCDEEHTPSSLRQHIISHRKQKEYSCDQCSRVFKKLNHLNTHKVKHLKEFPYKCEKCQKGFVIKKNYDCHILTHDTDAELPYECKQCLKRFSNPEHLHRHSTVHTENISYSHKYRMFRCSKCLVTFANKKDMTEHTCVVPEDIKVSCTYCKKVFKNMQSLYNHKSKVHKDKDKRVLCSACGKYVTNIYTHMLRHTGQKPFPCEFCEKRFVTKPQLNQHVMTHSGQKPFVCELCAKTFNTKYNFQVHERVHKGDKCHICQICKKGFLEKSYLNRHMATHSKGTLVGNVIK